MALLKNLGSRCGTVGRAVAYSTRGLRIECSHRLSLFAVCNEKTKIKKKEAVNGVIFITN